MTTDIYRYQTIGITVRLSDPTKLNNMTDAVISVLQSYVLGHYLYSNGDLEVDPEEGTLKCFLGQEDTAKFQAKLPLSVQVNISIDGGADRLVSKKVVCEEVGDNLYEAVMN